MDYLLGLPTTGGGLVWIGSSEWGSLRYAGNFAMFAMQVTSLISFVISYIMIKSSFPGWIPRHQARAVVQVCRAADELRSW